MPAYSNNRLEYLSVGILCVRLWCTMYVRTSSICLSIRLIYYIHSRGGIWSGERRTHTFNSLYTFYTFKDCGSLLPFSCSYTHFTSQITVNLSSFTFFHFCTSFPPLSLSLCLLKVSRSEAKLKSTESHTYSRIWAHAFPTIPLDRQRKARGTGLRSTFYVYIYVFNYIQSLRTSPLS